MTNYHHRNILILTAHDMAFNNLFRGLLCNLLSLLVISKIKRFAMIIY